LFSSYTVKFFQTFFNNEVLISHYYDSLKNIISFKVDMNINSDI